MRVLVTRPRDKAAALCAQLAAAGFDALCLPVIETQLVDDLGPLDATLARLEAYNWLVFASAEAARIFGRRANALGIPTAEHAARGRPRVVAGPAAAQALQRYGIPAQVVSPFSAERALAALAPLVRGGERVLLPRGEQGLPTLANGLRERGLSVHEVVIYRTVHAGVGDADASRALAAGILDAVTFFSPSAVNGFDAALATAALPAASIAQLKRAAAAACIGPTTAAAARAAGWTAIVEPADTTSAALVTALVSHLGPAAPHPAAASEAVAC